VTVDGRSVLPEVDRHLVERRSLLDGVRGSYRSLARRVSAADRQVLEAHLTTIREVERSLAIAVRRDGGACAPGALDLGPEAGARGAEEARGAGGGPARLEVPRATEILMDLVALAFACDLSRVANLMWGQAASRTTYTWLGHARHHHDLSHEGDGNAQAMGELAAIDRWHARMLARFAGRLEAIAETGATVLDNTTVVWVHELAKGNPHLTNGMSYVVVGDAGGALRTGRALALPGRSNNDLWVSMLHAMGVPARGFGAPEYNRGPLPLG
jgi:hypothetical protein